MTMSTGIPMEPSRKSSIAIVLYVTVATLCISQVTYDVTANETTAVQDTVLGTSESPNSSTTGDLDRPEDHIENTSSSTEDSPGFYQKYKQFVAKHNKTFTIVFGVLFVISLVGAVVAIAYGCSKGDCKPYVAIPILTGIGIVGFVLYKLYGHKVLDFFRSKKAPVVKATADTTG